MQRVIEAGGISTIALSNIPELTASVSVPRIAAIEYPIGLPLGKPGDRVGQMAVLRSTLRALVRMGEPGSIEHLPFEWPDPPGKVRTRPDTRTPITEYLYRRPWLYPRLLNRDIPDSRPDS